MSLPWHLKPIEAMNKRIGPRAVSLWIEGVTKSAWPTLTSGNGAPTNHEPKGSFYLRHDGSGASSVIYVATDAVGTWVALTSLSTTVQVATAGGESFVMDLLLSATGEAIVKLADNKASAFEIKEATTSYLKFVTTNAGELIAFGVPQKFAAGLSYIIDVTAAATGESIIKVADNLASALEIKEAANSYLKFITTNGSEAVVVGQNLTVGKAITRTPGASTAAAGTTTADAGVLPAGTASVYPTTAADDTTGVRIHASDQVTGRSFFVGNGVSNKILKVYAPSGGTINGAAGDAAFSTASGKGCWVHCLDSAGNTWLAS